MKWLLTMFAAHRAYKMACKNGSAYVGLTSRGVPYVACFIALDREAWRVSQRAIEEFRPSAREF